MEAHEINCQVLEYFIFCNLRIAVDWNSAECLPYLGWQLLELIWQYLTSREIAAHNVCRLITIITRSCRIVPDPQIETTGGAYGHNTAKDPIISDRPRGQACECNQSEH